MNDKELVGQMTREATCGEGGGEADEFALLLGVGGGLVLLDVGELTNEERAIGVLTNERRALPGPWPRRR